MCIRQSDRHSMSTHDWYSGAWRPKIINALNNKVIVDRRGCQVRHLRQRLQWQTRRQRQGKEKGIHSMFMACKAVSKTCGKRFSVGFFIINPCLLMLKGKTRKRQGNKRCSITQSFSQTSLFFFSPVSHLSCSTDRMREKGERREREGREEKALTLTYKDKEELFRDSRVTDASLDSSSSSHLIRQIYMLKQGKAKDGRKRWDMRDTWERQEILCLSIIICFNKEFILWLLVTFLLFSLVLFVVSHSIKSLNLSWKERGRRGRRKERCHVSDTMTSDTGVRDKSLKQNKHEIPWQVRQDWFHNKYFVYDKFILLGEKRSKDGMKNEGFEMRDDEGIQDRERGRGKEIKWMNEEERRESYQKRDIWRKEARSKEGMKRQNMKNIQETTESIC